MIPLLNRFTDLRDLLHFTLLTTQSCQINTNNINMLCCAHCINHVKHKIIAAGKTNGASPPLRGPALR